MQFTGPMSLHMTLRTTVPPASIIRSNSLEPLVGQKPGTIPELCTHQIKGSWGRERKPLYPEKSEFTRRLNRLNEKTGWQIPDSLYYALFYCIISKGHLLIDLQHIKEKSFAVGQALAQVIFILGFLSENKLDDPLHCGTEMQPSVLH